MTKIVLDGSQYLEDMNQNQGGALGNAAREVFLKEVTFAMELLSRGVS